MADDDETQRDATEPDANPGAQRIGNYVIEKKIGEGGMGAVYLAHHHGPEGFANKVCLKCIRPRDREADDQAQTLAHFLREARTAAALSHPNIVKVTNLEEIDGAYYQVLEYVDGMDLGKVLEERGYLSDELVFYIAIELCKALSYAHAEGVVHRDLSPDNIFIDRRGNVKLADFGIAKRKGDQDLTQEGGFKGKWRYVAPDYASGTPSNPTHDLYAVGVMLFKLLTGGVHPYHADPAKKMPGEAILLKAFTGQHHPLTELRPDLPAQLVELVERCIAPTSEGRPQSADDVLEVLASLPRIPLPGRQLAKIVRGEASPQPTSSPRRRPVRTKPITPTQAEPNLPPPEPPETEPSPPNPRRAWVVLWGIAFLLTVVFAASVGLYLRKLVTRSESASSGPVASASSTASPPPSTTTPVVPTRASVDAATPDVQTSDAGVRRTTTAPARTGWLSITPWPRRGYVFVDGVLARRRQGPVRVSVPVGTHVVGGGPNRRSPLHTRSVDVREGATTSVRIPSR